MFRPLFVASVDDAGAADRLSFSLWQYSEPPVSEFWKKTIERFEQETGAKVEIRNLPTNEYNQQLVIEIANGAAADIMRVSAHHYHVVGGNFTHDAKNLTSSRATQSPLDHS